MRKKTIFKAGSAGYASFRIPMIMKYPSGRILAMCEGRRDSANDCGVIDIVASYSLDGGETFSPVCKIVDGQGEMLNNPCATYDEKTGKIFMFLNGGVHTQNEHDVLIGNARPRTALLTVSEDEGLTWSPLKDLTKELSRDNWTWYAFGPCHALSMQDGTMIFPANHAVLIEKEHTSGPYTSHTVASYDHGETFVVQDDVAPNTNECSVTQTLDGRLYMNMRSYWQKGCRVVSYSADAGKTWSKIKHDVNLPDPVCQGNVYTYQGEIGGVKNPLLFSNVPTTHQRVDCTLRMSVDQGLTWAHALPLTQGPSAYSDIGQNDKGDILCLVECGENDPYERIDLVTVSVDELAK